MNNECYKGCGATTDLRPYGPKGEWVCFKCAFATPEDRAATERAFASQLNAAIDSGSGLAIAGGDVGPYPYSDAAMLAAAKKEVNNER